MTKTEPASRLWLHVAVLFFLFVVAGSLGLVALLQRFYQQRSQSEFAQLAQSNAEFIRTIHLPRNERFASYLSSVLGIEVQFVTEPGEMPVPDSAHEIALAPVGDGVQLALIRETPSLMALMLRPRSMLALGAFWGLTIGLAWAIAWGVVRPYIATRQRLVEAERLAMLGKMAASLAHEIQNPVAAIRLHTQLIQTATPGETAEASASSLPVILSEAERIEGLVNQWMFLTRPEPPRTSWVNLNHELQRAMESMNPLAAHAGVVVDADVPSELPVIADARRLRQVLGNLIQNAIQAMPNGGTIRIRGEVRGDRVQLSIADTGRGFSAEALRRFPELFFSEKEGGMGIGLSVAHEIVRAHQGSLTIGNQPGDTGGAVVTIELPLATDASTHLQNTPASSPGLTST